MVLADKSLQKIEDRHLFKDCKPSSDRVGSELGKSLIEYCSAWSRLKLNTKIGLNHHPPPTTHHHKLLKQF